MTDLNNEVREVTIDELDSVSGGSPVTTALLVNNYLYDAKFRTGPIVLGTTLDGSGGTLIIPRK
jgi:hypothetical protein